MPSSDRVVPFTASAVKRKATRLYLDGVVRWRSVEGGAHTVWDGNEEFLLPVLLHKNFDMLVFSINMFLTRKA